MTGLELDVENIGGVESASLQLDPGVTLVSGPNASNKTSLLTALAFAVGQDDPPLRAGTDRAEVRLSFDDTTIERQVIRRGKAVEVDGPSLLETVGTRTEQPSALAEFVSLLEFNRLRTAVRTNESIEALLKRPVDLDELERRQKECLSRKREVTEQIDRLNGIDADLSDRRSELAERRERREELREELETLRARRTEFGTGSDEVDELRERRATLAARREEFESEIGELEETIERLERQHEATRQEFEAAVAEVETYAPAELRRERDEIRTQLDEVDERIQVLQDVVTANREMRASGIEATTDRERSLDADQRRCWTCGSMAPTSAFDDALEDLTDLLADERAKRREWEPRLEEIAEELDTYRSAKRERDQAEERRRDVETRIEQRRESLRTKHESLRELEETLEELESEIDARHREQAADDDDLADEIESTQRDLYRTTNEIDRLTETIDSLVEDKEERQRLRDEQIELQSEIETLTERIDQTEQRLRESFNDAMDELMEVLAFQSIERVWLDGEFELVVAREVDGTIHRSPVTHLAESERETIGFVLGLAGYLAYDLAETVPMLLLDSMGAFDAERLASLIEFFAERTEYLLVAVYPELGEELPFPTQLIADAAPS
jgi:chromosome segregation ATPase